MPQPIVHTMHWDNIAGFAENHPDLLPARQVFCIDERVMTCAGGVAAADLLRNDFGIASDIWSVTSFNQLRRDGMEASRHNLLHPKARAIAPRPALTQCLRPAQRHLGPTIGRCDAQHSAQRLDHRLPQSFQPFARRPADRDALADRLRDGRF